MTNRGGAASRGVAAFDRRRSCLAPRRSTQGGSSASARSTTESSCSPSKSGGARTARTGALTLAQLKLELERTVYRKTRSEALAESVLSEIVEVLGGERLAESLRPLDVQTLIGYYHDRGNAPATINRKLTVLSRAARHARDLGEPVPPLGIKKLKESPSRTRVLTKQEQELLIVHAESLGGSFSLLVRFLLATGARVGEALRARWADIDFTRGWIRFEETKGDRPRGVPLPLSLKEELLDIQRSGRHSPFEGLSQRRVTYAWNKCRGAMGLDEDDEFVPHSLRHTCATELVASGVSLQVIQKWLGHRTLSMTQRYAHVHDDHLVAAMEKRI